LREPSRVSLGVPGYKNKKTSLERNITCCSIFLGVEEIRGVVRVVAPGVVLGGFWGAMERGTGASGLG